MIVLLVAAAAGCSDRDPSPPDTKDHAAEISFQQAADLGREGRLDGALRKLQRALDDGYPYPSRVLSDDQFQPLVENPETREQLSTLLKTHARESRITIVGPREPGLPLIMTIRIIDEATGATVPGAVIALTQTDTRGHYFTDDDHWNPRLFGYARTDSTGRVEIRTIRPGHYAAEYDADDQPAHVHFNVEADGYRPFGGEILFDDDPRLTDAHRAEAANGGNPIGIVNVDDDGVQRSDAEIRLQPR